MFGLKLPHARSVNLVADPAHLNSVIAEVGGNGEHLAEFPIRAAER